MRVSRRQIAGLVMAALVATPALSESLEITTDQDEYAPGAVIVVTIRNTTTDVVVMSGGPPFYVRSVNSGAVVAPCAWLTVIHELDPGDELISIVEQLDCESGDPTPWESQIYEVVLPYSLLSEPPSDGTATVQFCVGEECASTTAGYGVEAASWGRVKGRYSP